MKLGTIVTSANLNSLYTDFIPMFIGAWKRLFPECDVCVLLIADSIPENLEPYKHSIRLVEPNPNLHSAFQAQCIRLLYPQYIERDEGVLITDVDMIPLNRSYYEDPIKDVANDAFVVYRNNSYPDELYMCYNIAHPSVWRQMFDGETLESWYTLDVYDGNSGGSGWNIDQRMLTKKFKEFRGNRVLLNDEATKYRRLCRLFTEPFQNMDELCSNVHSGVYTDYHCLRPYADYKEINDKILSSLPARLKM